MDTPRLVGFAILELSTLTMYHAHYKHYKVRYGSAQKLLMMDTDSFVRLVYTQDLIADMERSNEEEASCIKFDLSKTASGQGDRYKGELGCFKYEPGTKTISENVGLQSKMYSLLFVDGTLESKGKGNPGKALKNVRHDLYRRQIEDPEMHKVAFQRIQSKKHVLEHVQQSKKGLSSFNDKVFQLDPFSSIPLGHRSLKVKE